MYLARSGKGNARRVKARSVHAPARRLARTTISLGPDEGIAFGLRAVRYSPHPVYLPVAILLPFSESAAMPAHVHSITLEGSVSSLHTVKFCQVDCQVESHRRPESQRSAFLLSSLV